ncbi:MAG: CBS domain-containing protein [Ardenticatenaceae bacterium]|nr:CBS domain-containing protein [Ardenticatenaceae bacterium]MCB8986936.1 CBS domain-containing protein [Ardenticatenaceae bacterium]
MLVRGRMSTPVITVEPSRRIMDAMATMKQNKIRRMPVIDNGKLVGIVSDKDLLDAGPSDATSLSVWEINYLLSKLRVEEVMTKKVLTVQENTPIEEAARIMVDNKIGGLPVMKGDELVGLITETDLFKIFQELMGARDPGVRVTALVPDTQGELDRLTHVISEAGGSFIAFGMFDGEDPKNKLVTFKVTGLGEEEVEAQITPVIERLVDLRTCCS